MLKHATLFAGLVSAMLPATAAGATEWRYENPGMPIAYVDTGTAQFHFACRGGELAMGFGVIGPDGPVAAASAMNLSITPDPAPGSAPGSGNTSYAQEIPLLHAESSWMVIRGPVARTWARIAQRARNELRLAFVRRDGNGRLDYFNATRFGAAGSSAAIQRVLDRCG